jgi:hypothetical protein
MQGAQGTVGQQAVAQTGTASQVAGTTPLKGDTATAATGELASSTAQLSSAEHVAEAARLGITPEALAAQTYALDATKTAELGGYTVGDAATGDLAAAQAQLSDASFIAEAKRLGVTPEALAAQQYSLDETQSAQLGNYTVQDAATSDTTPEGQAQTSSNVFEAQAQQLAQTPEAIAAQSYELEAAKAAQVGDYTVAEAAQTGTIPEAVAAQSSATSGVVAQQRNVSNDELANVAAQGLQMDEPVAAVAATMTALNESAKMIAQQGTFSQELATDRQGTVSAASTMQGQMASLMDQFNDGTPAWAAGAMRSAQAAMASRGLGASSMAGAAIVQAAMESAMPIAQNDAAAFATMGMANLNNRQQTSLANAAAQQNLSLTNLSLRQQTALTNSTNAFALQSDSLSNSQAVVLANQQVKYATQGKNLDVKTQVA